MKLILKSLDFLLQVIVYLVFGALLTSIAWGPLMILAFIIEDNPWPDLWFIGIFAALGALCIKTSEAK